MKDWCKKKWVASEAILVLLKNSEEHSEKTETLNTGGRKLQPSMYSKKKAVPRKRNA